MEKSRDRRIDLLRAIATICVVIGHIIQFRVKDVDSNLIFRLIYSFHMPLFFFISGYLTPNIIYINWIKNRFFRLFMPFVLWASINSFIRCDGVDDFINRFLRVFVYPDTGLWFLLVLFDLSLVLFIQKKIETIIKSKQLLGISTNIIISIVMMIVIGVCWIIFKETTFGGFRLLVKEILFFEIGYLIKQNANIESKSLCALIYVPFALLWHRTDFTIFTNELCLLHGGLLGYAIKIISVGIYYLTSLLGIWFWVVIVNRIKDKIQIIQNVGRYSLEIYVLSNYFFIINTNTLFIDVITNSVISIIAVIFVTKIIKRYLPIVGVLLLGHKYDK